jgi:ribosome-associated protein
MIKITNTISLHESELREEFIRASGPGGQNVNKVATAVQLRFDVRNSPSLPEYVRERLIRLAGSRITQDGILLIEAKRFRTQERNRQDAVDRLAELIRKSAVRPKARRKTKPSAASEKRRLESKNCRSKIKRMRRPVSRSED